MRRAEVSEGDFAPTVVQAIDPQPSPEARAQRTQLQQALWAALRELSPNHREVIALRDYLDLSYDEIATVLKVPRGTVMSRLHRARCRLREVVLQRMQQEVAHG